jgi:hypothetical protein
MNLCAFFPTRRTVAAIAISAALGAVLAIFVSSRIVSPGHSVAKPVNPSNARFTAIGHAYLPALGKAYAAAWEEGAKKLEAGASVAESLDVVSKTWSSNRTQLYDQLITPEFAKIVAESVKDADVTPQERAALAAAWRGFSLGLAK